MGYLGLAWGCLGECMGLCLGVCLGPPGAAWACLALLGHAWACAWACLGVPGVVTCYVMRVESDNFEHRTHAGKLGVGHGMGRHGPPYTWPCEVLKWDVEVDPC